MNIRTVEKLITLAAVGLMLCGCITKIENTYTIDGNGNTIRATDTATATPTTSDVVDAAGTGSGSATTNGGL